MSSQTAKSIFSTRDDTEYETINQGDRPEGEKRKEVKNKQKKTLSETKKIKQLRRNLKRKMKQTTTEIGEESEHEISNGTSKDTENRKDKRRKRKCLKRKEKRKEKARRKEGAETNRSMVNKGTSGTQYSDEDLTWGDEIEHRQNWPKKDDDEEERVRFVHLNANGITTKNEYVEWESLLHGLHDIQADVFCTNETNIDTRQSLVQFKVRDIAKQKDRHLHINMTSSKQTPLKRDSFFKPGGTMVGVRGHWSGRVIKSTLNEGKDDLGRWTITHMKGKGDSVISIISVYQVCDGGDEGENTAYLQQQTDFLEKYGRLVNPRKQLCKDLERVILSLIEKGNKVIVCADINDDASAEFNTQWNQMLDNVGLRNIHQSIHAGKNLPRTYDRGVRTLDMIAVSENISNDICMKAGILPFYSVSASDHRALYLDIRASSLFEEVKTDEMKHNLRRFTTKNVKKCDKYIENLTNLMVEAKMEDKVKEVCNDIEDYLTRANDLSALGNEDKTKYEKVKKELERRIQVLDRKRYQLMIAAENRCGKKKNRGMYWFSLELQGAAYKLSEAKKALRRAYTLDRAKKVELQ